MLTGEPQIKISQPVAILGMLQTSKSLMETVYLKNLNDANPVQIDTNHNNVDNDLDYGDRENNVLSDAEPKVPDKNPIINKRILLDNDTGILINSVENAETNQNNDNMSVKHIRRAIEVNHLLNKNKTDQIVLAKVPENENNDNQAANTEQQQQQLPSKPVAVESLATNEGRIVVYGDSNCLDSTHIEKPCFWLLDALLEYTMTTHISTVLKDLSRTSSIQFDDKAEMPQRLPNNNLHMYSQVLEKHMPGTTTHTKRPLPQCITLHWEVPIFLNVTSPSDLYHSNIRDNENELDGNVGALRRHLESQKGEVRSALETQP